VTIERHADVLRLVANDLARLADDADPAMLLTARGFIRGGAAATARIRPGTNASGLPRR
jgi:hypothetical protein